MRRVAAALRARGVEPVETREPGGTPVAEAIRRLLLEPGRRLAPAEELLLIVTARAHHVAEVIRPALEAGRVVLCDRFHLSTLAYQGAGRGLPTEEIRRLNDRATGGLGPDLTVVLDVRPETGFARKSGGADRMERSGAEFHERVARAYRALAASEPRVVLVDGERPESEVAAEVARVLAARLPGTFGPAAGLDDT
jgi:dTMP kinase